jgi:hypothetical protein
VASSAASFPRKLLSPPGKLLSPGVRRWLKERLFQLRLLTARWRRLPGFIVIGAQKCGTSSIYNYLAQHPELIPAFKKEIHYFDNGLERGQDHFHRGEYWYRAHFPLATPRNRRRLAFEASPMYCFHPEVPARIAAMDPAMKIVFMVRDPVSRAVSHYYHEVGKGRESLEFAAAIESEAERTGAAMAAGDYLDPEFKNHTYAARGLYAEQLERYLAFFPRDQVLVLDSAEFFSDPQSTLRRVFSFLGVRADVPIRDLTPVNVSRLRKQVDPAALERLRRFFAAPNRRFFDLVGREFDWG